MSYHKKKAVKKPKHYEVYQKKIRLFFSELMLNAISLGLCIGLCGAFAYFGYKLSIYLQLVNCECEMKSSPSTTNKPPKSR